jgi:hypothetical protein
MGDPNERTGAVVGSHELAQGAEGARTSARQYLAEKHKALSNLQGIVELSEGKRWRLKFAGELVHAHLLLGPSVTHNAINESDVADGLLHGLGRWETATAELHTQWQVGARYTSAGQASTLTKHGASERCCCARRLMHLHDGRRFDGEAFCRRDGGNEGEEAQHCD